MAGTKQTYKSVLFVHEDTYRKEKMVAILDARGLLNDAAKQFILQTSSFQTSQTT
jgi:hypothetical protein